jgi:hypothetical protein
LQIILLDTNNTLFVLLRVPKMERIDLIGASPTPQQLQDDLRSWSFFSNEIFCMAPIFLELSGQNHY